MVETKTKSQAKSKPSILLVCPLATGETRIHNQTWQSIQGLKWDEPMELLFMWDDTPDSPHMENLTAKMNRARTIFLQGNYDAMFVVESDMIVPPHALERLSRIKTDVAYGVYCSRRGSHRWLAYTALEDNGKGPVATPSQWGKTVESHGCGFGCTLIYRRALEAFEFRIGDEGEGADWNFAKDLVANGYKQVHDFGVLCGHILHHEAPLRIVWPTENAPYHEITEPELEARKMIAQAAQGGAYRTLVPTTSQSTGLTTPAGTILQLSAAQAADFLRKEIVELCDEPHEGELQ